MLGMVFTVALTTLLVNDPSVPRAFAQEKGIEVAGEWLLEDNADQPCAIFRHGSVLLLVNERGDLATGRLEAENRLVVLKGDGWDAGLTAEVQNKGKSLKWSNGTVWNRASAALVQKAEQAPIDIAGSYKDPRYPDATAEVKWDKEKQVFTFTDGSGASSTWRWDSGERLFLAENGGDKAYYFRTKGLIAFESKVFWSK
jgi:hypothetical protein